MRTRKKPAHWPKEMYPCVRTPELLSPLAHSAAQLSFFRGPLPPNFVLKKWQPALKVAEFHDVPAALPVLVAPQGRRLMSMQTTKSRADGPVSWEVQGQRRSQIVRRPR